MNATEEDGHVLYARGTHQENILFAMFYILVFAIAVPGNALALWAFCRQTASSPFKVFLRHLAVADVSYVLILPMRVVYHLSDSHWPLGEIPCRLAGFLFYVNLYSSLYLMTFISLDRLLAIALPVSSWTVAVRKPRYARVVVAVLWVIVVVSNSPGLLFRKVIIEMDNSTMICNQLYLEKTSLGALISTVVAFVIPLVAIAVSSVLILLKLRGLKRREKRPAKAIRMIVLVMMNFLLAFVPYHVSRVVYMTAASTEILARANRITSALTCISGILDPILYFFLANAYRNMLLKLFCRSRDDDQQTSISRPIPLSCVH